jgi:TetR/AcrR family transcriptional regulator, macrolide resistance operon repressor
MSRPKLHSDDQVLEAARRVILREGPQGFTLTDVAREIGLSRAALIQRFGDKAGIHRRVMELSTREVRDYFAAASPDTGLDALWAMLADLIEGLGDGEGFAGYLLIEWADVHDPTLNRLARERNALVRDAIAARLPLGTPDPQRTASLIQAVIQGASMQWLIDRPLPLNRFVAAQTGAMLEMLFPAHRFA